MGDERAHERLVAEVLEQARRLVLERAAPGDAAVGLAELCWHDIDALDDAHAVVMAELDASPTALASDTLLLLEAASDYWWQVQDGLRRQSADAFGVEIIRVLPPPPEEP